MQTDAFKIYIEQLRDGRQELISETFPPDFLEVNEKELSFQDSVLVKGEAYLAGDDLILHFNLVTFALLPCIICNEMVKVKIAVENGYHAIPLEEIKGGIFNFQNTIREAILLETPPFAECNEGNCSKRKELEKFLKKPESGNEKFHPFANL